ncbi:hypothetical protein BU17DRAFT_89003 [Hysterangium stoloniferum]|nr:hypothetical protein BU17DRAFT_89003 [Hysterangium stoloniferum]
MAAWWNAGHMDFLKLTSWETFEKQIRSCFMPKGYKMVALCTFFLCAQNWHSFLDYAATLADAHNALGLTIVNVHIYKYQLLFHSHSMLLLCIMAILDFDLETISFNNLGALMSMQWESLIMEIPATCSTPGPGPTRTSSTTTSTTLPHPDPLSIADRKCLSAVRGCWRYRKFPSDEGWTAHVGCTCPGDPAQGVTPGPDFAAPKTPTIKREPMGAILLDAKEYFAQGEDLPDDSIPICYRDDDTDSDASNQPN